MQTVFATNFFGAVKVTNAVLPYMRERKSGTIVMTGSRSAWRNEFAVRFPSPVIPATIISIVLC